MKYIVYGIVSAAILFLSVLMFLTVEGRTDHEKTLEEAVSLALDQTKHSRAVTARARLCWQLFTSLYMRR